MEALQAYQLEAAFCPVHEQADETGSADFLPSEGQALTVTGGVLPT